MKPWLRFYAENKLAWILPILILVGMLIYVAWSESQVPSNPYEYRVD